VNKSAIVLYLMSKPLIKKKRPWPHEPRHFGYPARMYPPFFSQLTKYINHQHDISASVCVYWIQPLPRSWHF